MITVCLHTTSFQLFIPEHCKGYFSSSPSVLLARILQHLPTCSRHELCLHAKHQHLLFKQSSSIFPPYCLESFFYPIQGSCLIITFGSSSLAIFDSTTLANRQGHQPSLPLFSFDSSYPSFLPSFFPPQPYKLPPSQTF